MANLQLIKDIAEKKNIPLADIASELGITPQALSKIMRNNSTKIETLEKIAHILKVSAKDFFSSGEGEMLKPETSTLPAEKSDTRPRIPTAVAAGTLGGFAESVKAGDCQFFPVVKAFPQYDYTIAVRGDSMTPEYKQGDEIAIRRVVSFIEWGKVYVLDTADGAILKRLYDNGDGKFRCVSINPEYPDFTVERECVFGVYQVVGLLRL